MQPAVSIIIIAYNAQATIADAIQSLLDQTLQNIEIVCVDDGSKDGTLALMQDAAAGDPRVRVFTQPNGGTLAARVQGLRMARSDRVMFLDSDDTYVPEAAELLCREAEQRNADILEFGVSLAVEDKNVVTRETIDWLNAYFSTDRPCPAPGSPPDELLGACFERAEINWNLWNKIYKKQLLEGALSCYAGEYACMAEDMLLIFMALCRTKSFGRVREPLYVYHLGKGISTSNKRIVTDRDVRVYGSQAQALRLQREWTKKLGIPEETLKQGVAAFRHRVLRDMMGVLFVRCMPGRRKDYLDCLRGIASQEELCGEVIDFSLVKGFYPPLEAVAALRDSWVARPAVREIKTVGMYCDRLYNGGIERVVALLTPILTAAGYQVVVITERGLHPLDYPLPKGTRRRILGREDDPAKRAARWRTILREENIDAVLYHTWAWPHLVVDSLAIKAQGCALIVHTHLSADRSLSNLDTRYARQDKMYALADGIVALSQISRAWWASLGYRAFHIVNPCTFDLAGVSPAPLEGQDVLWVGRLSPEKQYEEAFEIARLVHDELPGFRLRILGMAETTEENGQIADRLRAEGMDAYVCLEGFVTDTASYYQRAAAILSTSRLEGQPMTFLESKAFGLPMVAYDLPELDFFREPKGMLIADQGDRRTAAAHIISLLKNPELRQTLGREARQSVEELYRVPLAQRWREVFEAVLKEPSAQELRERQILNAAHTRALDAVEARDRELFATPPPPPPPPDPRIDAAIREQIALSRNRNMRMAHFLARFKAQYLRGDRTERKAFRRWLAALLLRRDAPERRDHRYHPLYNAIHILEGPRQPGDQ